VRARQSLLFFDLKISFSKSISIFHASLGGNARLARQAGDQNGDRYWSGLVGEVDDMIWQAVHAGFAYFQREAGYTRTGSHNARVHGPGDRPVARGGSGGGALAAATSRDGDMQLQAPHLDHNEQRLRRNALLLATRPGAWSFPTCAYARPAVVS
jgi:hypothetical protein